MFNFENHSCKLEILDIFCPKFNYLDPIMSEKTVEVHYNKHHYMYYQFLQEAKIFSLSEANATQDQKIINFAYQLIYHNMFWRSLSRENYLEKFLSIYPNFDKDFYDIVKNSFGSGWIILTKDVDYKWIFISNADEYDISKILLIFDMWEHSYYLQYYSDKQLYLQALLEMANYMFFEVQLNSLINS